MVVKFSLVAKTKYYNYKINNFKKPRLSRRRFKTS